MRLVLLHSPLVGPSTWQRLTPALEALRHDVVVPDYTGAMQGGGPYYPAIVETVHAALRDLPPVLTTVFVAHSGAGAILPSVAGDGFAIFMDALLPHPGQSWFDTAPHALKSHLSKLAQNGRVPPWHRWWPDGAIEALLGDAGLYKTFTAEARDLPLSYFAEVLPRLPGVLAVRRCAYLQLSEGYDAEADTAKRSGWQVEQLLLNHLAMLTHPEDVARLMTTLAEHSARD